MELGTNYMRNIFNILAVAAFLFIFTAAKGATFVTATITITNTPGIGSNFTVNGNSRVWTNSQGSPPQSWIISGGSVGSAATNLYNSIIRYAYSSPEIIPAFSSTNVITLRGTAVSVTTNNYSSVSYSTGGGSTNSSFLTLPMENISGDTNRTNNADWLVGGITKFARTNAFGTNAQAMTNYLSLGAKPQQSVSSPVLFTLLRASFGGLTNVYLSAVSNLSGTVSKLTNGYWTNGIYDGATLTNPVALNLINYGNAIRSEGTGANSFQVGSNAQATGLRAIAVGNSAFSSGDDGAAIGGFATNNGGLGTAVGTFAWAKAQLATAVGYFARADDTGTAVGNVAVAGTNGTAVGHTAHAGNFATAVGDNSSATADYSASLAGASSAIYALALGGTAAYSNSFAVGYGSGTTGTNQGMLGASYHTVIVPGLFHAETETNLHAVGTNRLDGDLSLGTGYTISTVADGHNTLDIGTNAVIDLIGSPTIPWQLAGMKAGSAAPRANQLVWLCNFTGKDSDIVHNDGIEANATYRISMATSTNGVFTNGMCVLFRYRASASRWVPMDLANAGFTVGAATTASATNAVQSVSTNNAGTYTVAGNLLTNISWTTGVTGFVANATFFAGVSVAPGAPATNANQFLGVPLSIKAGALQTNANFQGSGTNRGNFVINNSGTLTVSGLTTVPDLIATATITADTGFFDPAWVNNRVLVSDGPGTGRGVETTTTETEVGYVHNVTAAIQTQFLNATNRTETKQNGSALLTNLVNNPVTDYTNRFLQGWGIALVTNGATVTITATNRPASIATNATSATIDFSDTVNVNEYNAWFQLTTNLVLSPTNLIVGRTEKIYFNTNALTYDVQVTNTAGTRICWNFNVATNGSTAFTKTNTLRARLYLTAETNGVITADFGYYR